jgi:hypothetical protein
VINNRTGKEEKTQTINTHKQHLQTDISPGILLKMYVSNKFPNAADVARPETTFEKNLYRDFKRIRYSPSSKPESTMPCTKWSS